MDTRQEDAAARLKSMRGAQAVLSTIDDAGAVSASLDGLAPEGRLVVLNPGKCPLQMPGGLLVGGQRSVLGSITGTPHDNEEALSFSVLVNALPQIETIPLERATEAYQKMKSGNVKFRMVLTMAREPRPFRIDSVIND